MIAYLLYFLFMTRTTAYRIVSIDISTSLLHQSNFNPSICLWPRFSLHALPAVSAAARLMFTWLFARSWRGWVLCVRVSAQSTSIPAVGGGRSWCWCPAQSQQQQWPGRVVSSSSTVVLPGAAGSYHAGSGAGVAVTNIFWHKNIFPM